MHKKRPKICTGCRVSAAKIYLYHRTKIAKARPHRVEWQTDSSVQKQWFMVWVTNAFSKLETQVLFGQTVFRSDAPLLRTMCQLQNLQTVNYLPIFGGICYGMAQWD